jgi:hypothetical protein
MTTTSASPRTRHAAVAGTRPLAWAVLAAAVLEVVAPVVTIAGPGASPGAGSGPELLITPVGWAFSIWGVIYTLAIAQAVVVLVRGAESVPRALQVAQLVLYLGGAVWIVMSALDSSLLTALALLVMLVGGLAAVLTVARAPLAPRWFAVLTRTAVGLYAGWVTAAFFLNVSTALVDLDVVGARERAWQLVVLVVAAALLAALTLTTRIIAYAAAGTWALVGIAVTGSSNDDTAVLGVAVVLAVVLVAVLAAALARSRTTRTA